MKDRAKMMEAAQGSPLLLGLVRELAALHDRVEALEKPATIVDGPPPEMIDEDLDVDLDDDVDVTVPHEAAPAPAPEGNPVGARGRGKRKPKDA